jgi:aminoglycoside phosphotransferase (APT) family kinase protein
MSPSLPLDDLTRRVVRYFKAHAGQFELHPDTVQADYILNWGGFVNVSFTIQDGQRAYHLKLADDEDCLAGLNLWRELHALLEERYRAPRMLGWVAIPGAPYAGPLFERIAGVEADFAAQPALHRDVLALTARLHADQELAQILSADAQPITCSDYFIETYIDRFDEDLLIVAGSLPDFVSLATLDWMQGETRHLEALAREGAAFQQPARWPVHGDLWQANVLVTAGGRWYVVDWDDLALGDPALEFGILLGPFVANQPDRRAGLAAFDAALHLPAAADGSDLLERLLLCLRAYLLDEVIDTLADYVESDAAPQHSAGVRSAKQAQHASALQRYRRLYPDAIA